MLDKEIERSLENLTWDADEAVQVAARAYLIANIGDDLSPLFLSGSKSRWENCALVLRSFGRPRIDAYIPNFIEWMQDSNWPGHSEAQEILRMFDWEILEPHLRQAMTMAVISCDDPWVFSLSEIEMYFAKSQLSEQSLMEWELDDSIDKLGSYYDLEIQEKARRDVIDNIGADLRPLIMGGEPESWANKAMILKEIGRPRLDAFIPELLEWLRDKRWPGALIVAEVLAEMENETLRPHLQRAIAKAALAEKDILWVLNLQILKEKVNGRLPEGANPRFLI